MSFTFEDYRYDQLLDYAGIDAIVTLEILKKQWPKLNEKSPYTRFLNASERVQVIPPTMAWELVNIKAKALEFIVDMEVCGMPYDIEGNRKMGILMAQEVEELTTKIFCDIGREINLDSAKEVGNFLYSEMGFVAPIKTKSGDDAVSGDALAALFDQHKLPWLANMQKRKEIVTVYRSFIATYVEDYVKSDGRIHPEYNLHGTSSHRISSDNPNLLNLPRMCHQYDIRSLYVVPEGMVFLTMDFSSCEVKVLAALSGDETMIQAIREGKDFHTFTASMMSGVSYEDIHHVLESSKDELAANPALKALFKKYKDLRQAAKATTFGILYGSSIRSLAEKLGITEAEADKIVAAYFETYPRIKDFVLSSHAMAKENHYVYTPFGQRKQQFGTLPCYSGTAVANAALRNSQNVLIQSTASTLGLMAFAEVNRRIKALGGAVMCTVNVLGGIKTTLTEHAFRLTRYWNTLRALLLQRNQKW